MFEVAFLTGISFFWEIFFYIVIVSFISAFILVNVEKCSKV